MPKYQYSVMNDDDTLNSTRFATRVYLRLYGMAAHALAQKVGCTQPTIRTWCEVESPRVLTRPHFDRLMKLLMAEYLVTSDGKHTEKASEIAKTLEAKGVSCDTMEAQRKNKETDNG